MARRSWCCWVVMPAAAACSSLHLRNRRSATRNSSRRRYSSSPSAGAVTAATCGVVLGAAWTPSAVRSVLRTTFIAGSFHELSACIYIVSRYYFHMIAHFSRHRLLLLSGLAVLIGLAGGAAAWVLIRLIRLFTNIALFHSFSIVQHATTDLDPGWWIVIPAVIGAVLISLLAKWSPIIRGHGIPEAMEAVMTRQSRVAPRTAIAKPLSAAIAIGTGAPFGAEGPIIVTGGSLGSLLGQVLPVSPSERKFLLAAGAAAGMAATFGAPLSAVILAIELLLFEFSVRAFVPLVVATAVAAGVHSALFGDGPLFTVPANDYAGLTVLPSFVILGVACGLLAILITRGLFFIEDLYRRLPVNHFWHPAIGAIGFATIGVFVPRVLGVGYDVIDDVLAARLAVGTVAVIAVAKLV